MMSKEIGLVIKSFPKKKSLGPKSYTGNYQTCQEASTRGFSNTLEKIKEAPLRFLLWGQTYDLSVNVTNHLNHEGWTSQDHLKKRQEMYLTDKNQYISWKKKKTS